MSDAATTIMIFGALGDLTRRKLIPALFHLFCKGHLPERFRIIGVDRRDDSQEDFRLHLQGGTREFAADVYSSGNWESFSAQIAYVAADVTSQEGFQRIHTFLIDAEDDAANRLYHLAVPPFLHQPIAEGLGAMGMAQENSGWRRIVVEKPFGDDLNSAQELNAALQGVFAEGQIYRIDHYLGKETAQNIFFFRFANTLFELMWNRNYIDNVQITVAEAVDVGHRAGYYDQAGVLRDMFQNHLLQLMSLIAMEPPTSMEADALRNEKAKVLAAVYPIRMEDTVRAQYTDYRQAEGVDPKSQTATYAAMKLYIDTWRWQGVPFYLRSGKAMTAKHSEIVIELKRPPSVMFDMLARDGFEPNTLSLCIQPDEGIHFQFEAKVPDTVREVRSANMEFHYDSTFGSQAIPDAYERLLLDALHGDASLFTRSDSIEAAWRVIDPIIEGWHSDNAPPMASYAHGSWGPDEADALLAQEDRVWRLGCLHTES